jgi:hypothetical protein
MVFHEPRRALVGPMTEQEWISAYEERTNDKVEFVPGEVAIWDPMKGFVTYIPDHKNRRILLRYMCGDGKCWKRVIYEATLATGYTDVYCGTTHDPIVFHRMSGGTFLESKEINGKEWHFFKVTPETMRKVDRY